MHCDQRYGWENSWKSLDRPRKPSELMMLSASSAKSSSTQPLSNELIHVRDALWEFFQEILRVGENVLGLALIFLNHPSLHNNLAFL